MRVQNAVTYSNDYETSFAAASERGAAMSFDVRHGLEANDVKPVFAVQHNNLPQNTLHM
ncbi:MAG TPA: hypothetical protein VIN59_01610 [Alphaproteobacteria bacterium]